MRWVRFNRTAEPPSLARLGVVLNGVTVGDLRAAYASLLHAQGDPQARDIAALRIPRAIAALLALGERGERVVTDVASWLAERLAAQPDARGPDGEPLFTPLAECRLHAPLRLTNLIVTHGNYPPSRVPSFSMKPSGAVVGPAREITCPGHVDALRCGTGIAVVIGASCKGITEERATDVIAGYMVMTAVSIDHSEWDNDDAVFEAGMYESFAPSGPWLVTKDEVVSVADLRIEMRVNGAVRQQLLAGEMRWSVDRLVSVLSRMTLQAGDVIFAGGGDPSAPSAVVRVGDVVEGSVDGLGAICNRVVH